MTQKELIEEIYATNKFKDRKDVKIFLEVFEEVFRNKLVTDKKIILKNIGTFKIENNIRKRYMPKEDIVIEKEFLNISFKASKSIKKLIKDNNE